MNQDLISLLNSRMNGFSKGQKRIAAYLLEHYESAAFMTALSLGDTVGVSESTVVRFAAELGFDGYPQLQKAMQALTRRNLTMVERVEVTRDRMRDDEVLRNVMSYDVANMRRTLEELPEDVFYQVVDAMVEARELYIFGAGSCRFLASFFAHYLTLLRDRVHLIEPYNETEMFELMMSLGEGDVVLGISFPRYSSKAAKAMNFSRSKGAKVVALTDTPTSPIAPYADWLLLAHSDMASVVDSLVAPLSILNALTVAVSLRQLDRRRAAWEEMENLWHRYRVYQADEDAATYPIAADRPE